MPGKSIQLSVGTKGLRIGIINDMECGLYSYRRTEEALNLEKLFLVSSGLGNSPETILQLTATTANKAEGPKTGPSALLAV